MLLTFQSLKTNLTCTGFHIFEAAATVLPRCRGVGCLQPRARPMAPVFSPAESTRMQPVLGACIPPDGQFPAPVTHPPSGLQFWVTRVVSGTVSAYQPHDLSGSLTDTLYQFLFITHSPKPRARREICHVCSPLSLQGQTPRWARQRNFVIKMYSSSTTHTALHHQRDAELCTWLEWLPWRRRA